MSNLRINNLLVDFSLDVFSLINSQNFALFKKIEVKSALSRKRYHRWWDYTLTYHNNLKVFKNSGGENFDTLTKGHLLRDYKLRPIPHSNFITMTY